MLKMSIVSKSSLVAAIVALALASVSATSVFAAGSKTTTPHEREVAQQLASSWKTDATSLHLEVLMASRIAGLEKAWLKDHTTAADKAKANDLVNRFDSVLRQAESIAKTHAGFNGSGVVTNATLASKSVKDLSSDLNQLHIRITNQILSLFA